MRLTKIICTLGPACNSPEMIAKLAESGMNVARINFSHGDIEQHRTVLRALKAVNDKGTKCINVMLDTKGSEIRTGDVKEPIMIKAGQEVVFSFKDVAKETRTVIKVDYAGFAKDVGGTDKILLDNGEQIFDIVKIDVKAGAVVARSREGGKIGSRRHVNLPGADVGLPSLAQKDWDDISLGIAEGADAVALSFIRTAADVIEVKKFLKKKKSEMKIISKIETRQAVENIDAIIKESDGVMVARGDLGAELPFERIPAIQDRIVEKCRIAGKPVIVATHMLESMISNPTPTRAEVTDVAHAAVTLADCTMLSGETAAGKHPIVALEAMGKILAETERNLPPLKPTHVNHIDDDDLTARAQAGVSMAQSLHASAIVVLTRSGLTAQAVSQFRPRAPIIAFTESGAVQRELCFSYGVTPIKIEFSKDPESNVSAALKRAVKQGLLKKGDRVVVLSDAKVPGGIVRTVHIRTVA